MATGTGKSLSELERSWYAQNLEKDFGASLPTAPLNATLDYFKRTYIVCYLRGEGETVDGNDSIEALERHFIYYLATTMGTAGTKQFKNLAEAWPYVNIAFSAPVARSLNENKRNFFNVVSSIF